METPAIEPQQVEPTPIPKKQCTRVGRKRTVFRTTPKPAWPVRGLWESAPQEERERAHETCMQILEYWLGKKAKGEVAEELEITPLRVWQLSQQALSGMLAGLLPQPRRRVSAEVFEAQTGQSPGALKKRIAALEKQLARTEDLVRVLRTAPWMKPSAESPRKGGSKRGRKKKSKSPARPQEGPRAPRTLDPGNEPIEGGTSGSG